jgi:hypothetical protein
MQGFDVFSQSTSMVLMTGDVMRKIHKPFVLSLKLMSPGHQQRVLVVESERFVSHRPLPREEDRNPIQLADPVIRINTGRLEQTSCPARCGYRLACALPGPMKPIWPPF